jgi:signal transduction histidine kinase
VIEFFARNELPAEVRTFDMLEAIGSEIGQFVQRKKAETEREELLVREKTLRAQAENISRLKDEFLATVSHELRTPLNSILGWGKILQMGKLGPEEQKTALETIHRNALSQAQLIEDLLDTSRLITGNLRLELSPTDVVPLITTAIDVIRPAVDAKGISVSTEFSDPNLSITCDSHRLQQMVSNLLTNAVKFTPNEGSITVKCEHVENVVQIIVSDTGQGIDPDFLPFIFDRFRQADSSSTRTKEGVGLGLAIVRHLAELHGGAVSAVSEGHGKGSIFTIEIPAALARDQKKNMISEISGAAA